MALRVWMLLFDAIGLIFEESSDVNNLLIPFIEHESGGPIELWFNNFILRQV